MKLFKNKNICYADNSKKDCSTIQTIRELQKKLNNLSIPEYKQPSDFLSEIKYFKKELGITFPNLHEKSQEKDRLKKKN